MSIESLNYLVFLLVALCLYFVTYKVAIIQRMVLLFSNIFFIVAISGKKSLFIIFLLIMVTYVVGIQIEKSIEKKRKRTSSIYMWTGIFLLVGVLCYFKFFKDTFFVVQMYISHYGVSISDLITPIGISYYTLTLVAYILDVYHHKHPAEKDFISFITFVTFFPSIIQGPINLYKKVMPQIKEVHKFDFDRMVNGLQRILWGYFKKIVIADRIGILVIGILKDTEARGILIIWALVLYSFQIYTDFSGGIDVVMGVSEIMGIQLIENFKAPLISKSVTEYWARWHMSLGEFMEKYIYYPIVLNRKVMRFSKKIPNKYMQRVFSATFASVIVFIIVGIWHGTGWNYVVYGCYQAFFVSSAVLLGPVYKKINLRFNINEQSVSWNVFRIVRTFSILVIGRYFIRANSLTQAMELFHRSFDGVTFSDLHVLFDNTLMNYGLDWKNIVLMYVCIILIIIVDIAHNNGIHFRQIIMKQDIAFRYFVYLVGIFSIIIFGVYGPGFTGGSFIYQGF